MCCMKGDDGIPQGTMLRIVNDAAHLAEDGRGQSGPWSQEEQRDEAKGQAAHGAASWSRAHSVAGESSGMDRAVPL